VKKIIAAISFIFILTLVYKVYGQGISAQGTDTLEVAYKADGFHEEDIKSLIQKKKLKLNIEVGTTFGTTFGNGSYFGTYLSPNISYPVSKRFTVSTGGYLLNTQGLNQQSEGVIYPYNPFVGSMTRTFLYVKGAYRLNENITLTGAAYKEFNAFNAPQPNVPGGNYNYEGFIMGVDYQLGENVFIRGQVEFSNGNSPYRYSPMHPASQRIHGIRDPFGPGF
jgi:hypothetical protein